MTPMNKEREDETSEQRTAGSVSPLPAPPGDDAARLQDLLVVMDGLRSAERFALLRRLTSHIAHELGTPLNVIQMRAQMMESGEFEGPLLKKNANIIAERAAHMTKILRDVLEFARSHVVEPELVELRELAKTAAALQAVTAERRGVRVELDPSSEPAEVAGDPAKFLQVMMNLLLNGVQATREGGTVHIATRLVRRSHLEFGGPEAEFGVIEVRDTGPGIPKELTEQIFKPFFTTRDPGEGAGLGLCLVQGIAKDHGGWIDVESEIGKGSRFTVYLPRGAR
jgi:two-component system, NtrC family, sensor kinase